MTLSQEHVKKYLDEGGTRCPYCQSYDIIGESWEAGAGEAWHEMRCEACGESWEDQYGLITLATFEDGVLGVKPTVEQIEAQFAETGQYPDWRRMEERGDLDE